MKLSILLRIAADAFLAQDVVRWPPYLPDGSPVSEDDDRALERAAQALLGTDVHASREYLSIRANLLPSCPFDSIPAGPQRQAARRAWMHSLADRLESPLVHSNTTFTPERTTCPPTPTRSSTSRSS